MAKDDDRPQLFGGSQDGARVREVHQDVILNPCGEGKSGIPKVEEYRRRDDGNFDFVKLRLMTPDEQREAGLTP